jgi:hypothetical protein
MREVSNAKRDFAGVGATGSPKTISGSGVRCIYRRGRVASDVWRLLQFSHHARAGGSQLFSEFIATFGLLCVIWGCARLRSEAVPVAVGLYITSSRVGLRCPECDFRLWRLRRPTRGLDEAYP